MAGNSSMIAVPQNLTDPIAMRRFLETLVLENDKLRRDLATLEAVVESLK